MLEQIKIDMKANEKLKTQAKVNKIDTFKLAFEKVFMSILIERMGQNKEFFDRIIDNREFGEIVKNGLARDVYSSLRQEDSTRV